MWLKASPSMSADGRGCARTSSSGLDRGRHALASTTSQAREPPPEWAAPGCDSSPKVAKGISTGWTVIESHYGVRQEQSLPHVLFLGGSEESRSGCLRVLDSSRR
jgi:hypothetical protein